MPRIKNDNGIGERAFVELTKLIYSKDMDVKNFCSLHGLSKGTVYQWQAGGCPSARALQRLDALGLDIHYILSGSRS